MTDNPTHIRYMKAALALARRGLGSVWPNPAVGCAIVQGNRIVGRGWTRRGGRPHAEMEALAEAGELAQGATAYVSLEPCCHYGQTPPCTKALIEAGITRVVAAVTDPDPRVSGQGFTRLEQAGLEVIKNVCRAEAVRVNAGFFLRMLRKRPLVTLKTATTLDGRIATRNGESQWITGVTARRLGHRLRSSHDAVLVGIGTVLTDNPRLTCRLSGSRIRPSVRVVLDSGLRLPLDSELMRGIKETPLWIFCGTEVGRDRQRPLKQAGAAVFPVARNAQGYLSIQAVLAQLAEQGITRLLVEGGGQVAASFLRAECVDELVWCRTGGIMGEDGRAAVAELGLDSLSDLPRFTLLRSGRAGADVVEYWRADPLSADTFIR